MNTFSEKDLAALAYIWGKYRIYANTSRLRKAELAAWRFRILIFSIAGALFGTTCQETIRLGLKTAETWSWVPTLLGWLSAGSLGLAVYFGKEMANPDQERRWIRSHSTAEALKTEVYLFRSETPPYDTFDRPQVLLDKADELFETVEAVSVENLNEEERRKNLPTESLAVETYIEERVNDQINNFYRPRVEELNRKLKQNKTVGIFLGVGAVILGAIGSSTNWTAGWVAVISTVIASVAAYAYAGRYQYLIISYQATADKLERLCAQWRIKGMTDANIEERNKFILDCEQIISIENNAWMAEMVKEKKETVAVELVAPALDNQVLPR